MFVESQFQSHLMKIRGNAGPGSGAFESTNSGIADRFHFRKMKIPCSQEPYPPSSNTNRRLLSFMIQHVVWGKLLKQFQYLDIGHKIESKYFKMALLLKECLQLAHHDSEGRRRADRRAGWRHCNALRHVLLLRQGLPSVPTAVAAADCALTCTACAAGRCKPSRSITTAFCHRTASLHVSATPPCTARSCDAQPLRLLFPPKSFPDDVKRCLQLDSPRHKNYRSAASQAGMNAAGWRFRFDSQFADKAANDCVHHVQQVKIKLFTMALSRNGSGDDGDALRCDSRRVNEQAAVLAEMKLLLLPGYQA